MFILPQWDKLHPSLSDIAFSEQEGLLMRYVGHAEKPEKNPIIADIVKSVCSSEKKDDQKDTVHLIQLDPESLYQVFLRGGNASEKYADLLWEMVKENAASSTETK